MCVCLCVWSDGDGMRRERERGCGLTRALDSYVWMWMCMWMYVALRMGEKMTLRESMQRSAQLTMEHLQKERRVPDGAAPTLAATHTDTTGTNDDFIFPRFDATAAALAAASSAAAATQHSTTRDSVSSPSTTPTDRRAHLLETHQRHYDAEEEKRRLPPVTRDVSCHACGWAGVRYRCSRCGTARYCSARCQKKHWPEHKLVCAIAAQATALMSPITKHL